MSFSHMPETIESQQDLNRLLAAVRGLSQARSLSDVMSVVRVAARELSHADGVTFVLRDGDQCYYAEENAIGPLWKGLRFPANNCISGWAMRNKQVVVIVDIFADDRIPHDAYRPTFVKSLAMIPVRKEDPIAAIGAYWAAQHEATARELNVLQMLADSTALALANVELYEGLRKKADDYAGLYERAQREIATRERLEEQLRQAQKMEAIGRVAGDIAHDFSNHLTVIAGYSELMEMQAPKDSKLQDSIRQIRQAGEDAKALTSQLMAFSRKQPSQLKLLDVNQIILKMDPSLRQLAGPTIEIEMKLDPQIGQVKFDPGQIQQVVMNFVVNSRDAMANGGKVTIETANATLSAEDILPNAKARPGAHVLIWVSDTGSGMDDATKARIFEPFFTTKAVGKGTGLGLSTVYGIVHQNAGIIKVQSELGKGTTFRVFIPAH